MTTDLTRRHALALLGASAGIGAGVATLPGRALAMTPPPLPWLATQPQIVAEWLVRQAFADPEVARIQAAVRAELAASRRGAIPDAAATLDRAIGLWTHSLIFGELGKNTARPAFHWATDDTPRTWLGYTLGGVGTSGDNPDAIYRSAGIAGGGRYEIVGRFHPSGPPTQVLIEVNAGDMTQPANVMPIAGGQHADIRNAAQINQDQFVVAADGAFRITLAPEGDGAPRAANHLTIPASGHCMIGVRDILSDWQQRASSLTINRLDRVDAPAFGIAQLREAVRRDLAGYIRFWSNFPNIWFGGLKPNSHSAPQQRPGGWGFVVGVNYHLADDEALVVTTTPGGARYTGFQVIDPWMMAPDAREGQVCLNNSQATPGADGTVSYVIARGDPGAANWLDTAGCRDGFAIIRWQGVPADLKGDSLIREFRVAKLSEVSAMEGLPRVTAAERKARVAARRADYDTRVR